MAVECVAVVTALHVWLVMALQEASFDLTCSRVRQAREG